MAVIYTFPLHKRIDLGSIRDVFSSTEHEYYLKYLEDGERWSELYRADTLNEGYPFQAPCNPMREDMIWYVDERKNFATWVINHSDSDIFENETILFGWSPFVRYSTAPPHEPIHIKSLELRKHLAWYVDSEGYGQYAVVKRDEEIWVPLPRPEKWVDHNISAK